MAKASTTYLCTSCEAVYPAWQGKCTSCGEWNTIVRDNFDGSKLSTPLKKDLEKLHAVRLKVSKDKGERTLLNIKSFNDVLGGGLVGGQIILFAGEPGIGKSTLLTGLCIDSEMDILYISGEESIDQITKRASRLAPLENFSRADFSNDVDLESILLHIGSRKYGLVIIDSIQTVQSSNVSGYPGSMNQIRECANYISDSGKKAGVGVIMIGQITKEGNIAGPKLLEHMVDTVLYFEGDRRDDTRILRVTKNRFGSTNEIAVYEMDSDGLKEVSNIERYFIEDIKNEDGIAYTIYQEGSLSLILEVQALCTKTSFSYPKRIANGYDSKRLELILAILSKKLNLHLEDYDVFINIVGGLKVEDTSADLAVAMAIISSLKSKSLSGSSCFIGELGLTGEIKTTSKQELRMQKAEKLGFKKIYSNKSYKTIFELTKNITGAKA